MNKYQVCSKCIMDTSDREIQFDENGICNHCRKYEILIDTYPFNLNDSERQNILGQIINEIKTKSKGKKYDCVIGVSGGVDSSFVAYKVKEFGLRPLAVHIDNGWNSELAVSNIEKMLKILGIDLYTHVLDWDSFKDLQIAFLKASVPEAELPSDHLITPTLSKIAKKIKTKYIILGTNIKTEGVMPRSWVFGHRDWKYIKSIHKQFGTKKLVNYPHIDPLSLFYYKFIAGQKTISILNYIDYNKNEALQILNEKLGWKYYGDKHYESIYTRFFQGYILPSKFNMDKRLPHLSALILSGQITREEALRELNKNTYSTKMMNEDKQFVIKKFGFSEDEFDDIMRLPVKTFWDYPSYHKHPLFKIAKSLNQLNDI